MNELVKKLIANNLTIASCESLTGGLFAASLTKVSGVSKVYKGSLITYQNDAKIRLLGLFNEEIGRYGVISEYTASFMALKTKELLDVDIALSFTGNAGPDTLEGKKVGLVYIGICIKDKIKVFECNFNGNRDEIRNQSIDFAKKILLDYLSGKDLI